MASNSLFAPLTKLVKQIQARGVMGTVIQLYTIGDLKFGTLKGTDKFGNKYYEDLDQPYGQHRWVEFSNIHDPDATMIQPEWHGWMHHMFDETPDEVTQIFETMKTTSLSHAVYGNHIGLTNEVEHRESVNVSQYRNRGYKIGSLMSGPDDPEPYYKQPGHPLSPLADKGGRFKDVKTN